MWAVWLKDERRWMYEPPKDGNAILVFASKRQACDRAAQHYGWASYSRLKALDWCEVFKLGELPRNPGAVPQKEKA